MYIYILLLHFFFDREKIIILCIQLPNMVRKYKRLTNQQSWEENSMKAAIESVMKKEMGYKKASLTLCIPTTTLRDRIKRLQQGSLELSSCAVKKLGNFKLVFNLEQEQELAKHLIFLESCLFPVTMKDLRELAFQLAEKNKMPHNFNKKTGIAGYQWAESFLKHNPVISLRMPEGTSGARAMGFNRPAVNKFFELLTKSIAENNITPNNIYNVDEIGISSVPKKV